LVYGVKLMCEAVILPALLTTPMSDFKFDQIDLKIVKILQENSKITNLELSRQVGLSPAPTLERVKKLETSGIITSYHAVVNPQTLGLNVQTFVQISLSWNQENAYQTFLDKINDIPEVMDCYIITGDADLMLRVITKDIPSYEMLMFQRLSQIKEVERFKTIMTLSTVKSNKVLPFEYE
jgi:Lrp/AsnC family transcriptional regulator, leucine-responsive regulatory protein